MEPVRVLGLTRYGRLGASSRLRFYQFLPWLQAADISVTVAPFLGDEVLLGRYKRGGYTAFDLLSAYRERASQLFRRGRFDLLWIEKEALPWWPAWLELAMLRSLPFVLDYDDAVFHNYDLHRNPLVRGLLGDRLDKLMKSSGLVVAGNDYLAARALSAGATRVVKIPTVVDVGRYNPSRQPLSQGGAPPRLVWIGSPTTAEYLQLIAVALQELARRQNFILRLIGAGRVDLPGVQVEAMEWSDETEADLLAECDVGIMPLKATPWELGKCGYKLIQYMAAGLPCVASAVGANAEIIKHDESGYLVERQDGWLPALEVLLSRPELRERMGKVGRTVVESSYSAQQRGPELALLLRKVAMGAGLPARCRVT
jgi:glycosyltransferase involved in cell wall biosynthesis